MTPSTPLTASTSPLRERRSTRASSSCPPAPSHPHFAASVPGRTIARTACPRRSASATTYLPRKPDAPVINSFIRTRKQIHRRDAETQRRKRQDNILLLSASPRRIFFFID